MTQCFFAFFILLLTSFSVTEAVILESQHFSEIVSHVTPETLVILDIDDTLIVPKQMLGCDEWFQFRLKKYQKEGMTSSQALEKALAEWEAVRHLTKMEIVEPGTEEIVKSLQNQGHCIIGLTTQGLALATRTTQQLKENCIDLSLTAPEKSCYIHLNDHGVLYRDGILFTSGTPKGAALFKLCQMIDYFPKRIVFINDKASHLADIEVVAQKYEVEFIGLRYAYSDKRKNSFCAEIAELQFSHSTLNHLLSDEEAFELKKRR